MGFISIESERRQKCQKELKEILRETMLLSKFQVYLPMYGFVCPQYCKNHFRYRTCAGIKSASCAPTLWKRIN